MTTAEIAIKLNQSQTGEYMAIVRRLTLKDDGTFHCKEGLTVNGEWVAIPEGCQYPDECIWLTDARIISEELWHSVMSELTTVVERET